MKNKIKAKFPKYPTKKIRKGDKVLVISGSCKGQTGIVHELREDKAIVQGLNLAKKFIKATQERAGSIIEIERPIHVSNLTVCGEDGKALKLKVKTNADGQREYIYKQGDQEVVYRSVKTPK
jgi:large subunit ribosomal protein L24